MASLTDLFNPTFLMFLGILVLVVALLVVYFESKFRDQNHKISSMLSLVSSLAEEVNGTKMIIQHLSMRAGSEPSQNFSNVANSEKNIHNLENTNTIKYNKLIAVSDDEDSDDDIDDDDDSDDNDIDSLEDDAIDDCDNSTENDNQSIQDLDDNSVIEIGEKNDIKVFKMNITNNENIDNDNFDNLDELDELSDSENENIGKKNDDIKSMDFKSINISLEETKNDTIDYKKLTLPKLRSVVLEKGLSADTSKLKKNELLKLLGVE